MRSDLILARAAFRNLAHYLSEEYEDYLAYHDNAGKFTHIWNEVTKLARALDLEDWLDAQYPAETPEEVRA